MKYILTLLLLTCCVYPIDIYLKNGTKILNAKKAIGAGTHVTILLANGQKIDIHKSDVDYAERHKFDPNRESQIIGELPKESEFQKSSNKQQRLHLLPISALSFAVAWDSFEQADNISRTINELGSLGVPATNLDYLRDEKDRKQLIAMIALAAGAVNLYLAVAGKKVRVTPSSNSITLAIPLN